MWLQCVASVECEVTMVVFGCKSQFYDIHLLYVRWDVPLFLTNLLNVVVLLIDFFGWFILVWLCCLAHIMRSVTAIVFVSKFQFYDICWLSSRLAVRLL